MVEERSDHMAVSPVVALPSHPQRNPQSLKISPNFHLIDLPFGSIPFIIEVCDPFSCFFLVDYD